MYIPFHNNCREGWGCHPSCPVLALARKARELDTQLAKLQAQIEKKPKKAKPND